jgi:hypothetical protein
LDQSQILPRAFALKKSRAPRVDAMTEPMPAPMIDRRFIRRARPLKTITAMVRMYCHGHAHADRAPLCSDCTRLLDYATRRLERCVFGDTKPNCSDCIVHCYRADMREQIRTVMRWAGPRMLLRHPILAIAHLLAERRPGPALPPRMLNGGRYRGRS